MKLRISQQAEQDICDIGDFTADRWGEQQAAAYLRTIYEACARLTDHPKLGRRRHDLLPPYLAYKVESHVIIYRVGVANDRIEVLNVLHTSMNIARRVAATPRQIDY